MKLSELLPDLTALAERSPHARLVLNDDSKAIAVRLNSAGDVVLETDDSSFEQVKCLLHELAIGVEDCDPAVNAINSGKAEFLANALAKAKAFF